MDKNIKELYVSKVCKEFNEGAEILSLASFADFLNKYVASITRVDGRGFRLQDRLDNNGTNAYLSSNKWKRDHFPANYSNDKTETNIERIVFKDVFSEIFFHYKNNIKGNPFFTSDCYGCIINSFNIVEFYEIIDFVRVVYYNKDMSKRWDMTASNWEFLLTGNTPYIAPHSIVMTSRISLSESEKRQIRFGGPYIESVYLKEDVSCKINIDEFSKMIYALLSFYSSITDRTNKEILLEEEKIKDDVILGELEQVGIINVEKTEKT